MVSQFKAKGAKSSVTRAYLAVMALMIVASFGISFFCLASFRYNFTHNTWGGSGPWNRGLHGDNTKSYEYLDQPGGPSPTNPLGLLVLPFWAFQIVNMFVFWRACRVHGLFNNQWEAEDKKRRWSWWACVVLWTVCMCGAMGGYLTLSVMWGVGCTTLALGFQVAALAAIIW